MRVTYVCYTKFSPQDGTARDSVLSSSQCLAHVSLPGRFFAFPFLSDGSTRLEDGEDFEKRVVSQVCNARFMRVGAIGLKLYRHASVKSMRVCWLKEKNIREDCHKVNSITPDE